MECHVLSKPLLLDKGFKLPHITLIAVAEDIEIEMLPVLLIDKDVKRLENHYDPFLHTNAAGIDQADIFCLRPGRVVGMLALAARRVQEAGVDAVVDHLDTFSVTTRAAILLFDRLADGDQ